MLHLRPAAIAAVLILAAVAGRASAGRGSVPSSSDNVIRIWADGPVRYLMSTKEDEAVRQLKSIPDLSRYISDFWARRDPTPGTLENEFRRQYWGRVLEAEHRFRDSTTPGWMTDRGKIYILLGEPYDVQTDENPTFSAKISKTPVSADAAGRQRGIQRWTYHRARSRTADAEFVVAFVRDGSLDWKLSTDPSLIELTYEGSLTESTESRIGEMDARITQNRTAVFGNAARAGAPSAQQSGQTPQPGINTGLTVLPPAAVPTQPTMDQAFSSIDTSLFANYDLGLETSVPTAAEEMIATVTARQFLSAFPADARFEFFRAADRTTFVNVGAIVNASDLYPPGTKGKSSLRVYASVTPNSGGAQARYTSNDSQPESVEPGKGPAPGGIYDVWTGLALKPGSYQVTLAIEDSLTGRIGRAAVNLEVPDLWAPGLRLSTLVLGSEISESATRLGVTARASGTFRKSESLGVYYEVYGLPEGDAGRFRSSYRFYREMPDGAPPSPIGKPIVFEGRTGPAQGWSFPLAKWPVGRFRMEVTVTRSDRVAVTSQVRFEIVE